MNKKEKIETNTIFPDLANMPSVDGMLALYEKVLAELDSAISAQKEFASGGKNPVVRHN